MTNTALKCQVTFGEISKKKSAKFRGKITEIYFCLPTDFGMSRASEKGYYTKHETQLPVKW